ncbi:MAG: 2-amino-4-hydroxy-6-hydroxymethyldihydropteridine diphosphokinase [Sphingomonadales bacterium CG12_big_fil_rev_8_21_14_0_65_65_10]|nr:MAG: 2-amino-4-hydroxy-6-hydroxymethyldihydropteridine diphosphokinase [Sphingomonadales bacterium CG12_big_fil_rev_8_21_14_0_65_65_10]
MRGYLSNLYLVALGSNRRLRPFGDPRHVVRAAMEELAALGTVTARSPIVASDPVGPAQRRFANAAVLLDSAFDPSSLLAGLKRLEREFGRRRSGQRWRDRTLDLDIVLWSGGAYAEPDLQIPHPLFRERDFVLAPAAAIAPRWRDPVTGRTLRQLANCAHRPA